MRLGPTRCCVDAGPEVAAESALRGARASAALDGAVIDLSALREAVRGGAVASARPDTSLVAATRARPVAGMDASRLAASDAAVIRGSVRVSAELAALAPTWRRAPLQVLARLHLLAATDLLDPDRLGRPRGPGDPDDPGDPGDPGGIARSQPGWPPHDSTTSYAC